MWLALIKRYWQVSTFKLTPAETPYSHLLLGITAFIFFLLIIFQWIITDVLHQYTFMNALLTGLSLIASYVIYTFALLGAFHRRHRSVQTLTCLFACHTIVHLFAFPLLLVMPLLLDLKSIEPLALLIGVVYLLLTLILTVWQFIVTTFIYKQALAIDNFPATLASVGLLGCNILTVSFWR